jgi:hypothetical protein
MMTAPDVSLPALAGVQLESPLQRTRKEYGEARWAALTDAAKQQAIKAVLARQQSETEAKQRKRAALLSQSDSHRTMFVASTSAGPAPAAASVERLQRREQLREISGSHSSMFVASPREPEQPPQLPAPDYSAKHAYQPAADESGEGRLALKKGELICVTDSTGEAWWAGYIWVPSLAAVPQSHWFPRSYVEPYEQEERDDFEVLVNPSEHEEQEEGEELSNPAVSAGPTRPGFISLRAPPVLPRGQHGKHDAAAEQMALVASQSSPGPVANAQSLTTKERMQKAHHRKQADRAKENPAADAGAMGAAERVDKEGSKGNARLQICPTPSRRPFAIAAGVVALTLLLAVALALARHVLKDDTVRARPPC